MRVEWFDGCTAWSLSVCMLARLGWLYPPGNYLAGKSGIVTEKYCISPSHDFIACSLQHGMDVIKYPALIPRCRNVKYE